MICFYHNADLDGHCSGAIIKYRYPDCFMIGVDYNDGTDPRDYDIQRNEDVFVVDFCFPLLDMIWLHQNCRLRWIDHHESSIDNIAYHKKTGSGLSGLSGLARIGQGACELVWEYLFSRPIPMVVYYIGRHDVWDHSDPRVLAFQYGLRAFRDTGPDLQFIWKALIENTDGVVADIIGNGRNILEYENNQNKKMAEFLSYETSFHKLRALVINHPFTNSKIFDSVYNPNKHDIMIKFHVSGPPAFVEGMAESTWKYTLYSNKDFVNCAEIAKLYDGGGHKGAAGFRTNCRVV